MVKPLLLEVNQSSNDLTYISIFLGAYEEVADLSNDCCKSRTVKMGVSCGLLEGPGHVVKDNIVTIRRLVDLMCRDKIIVLNSPEHTELVFTDGCGTPDVEETIRSSPLFNH